MIIMKLWNFYFASKCQGEHLFAIGCPMRTTIAVAALPLGACVEIDLIVKA